LIAKAKAEYVKKTMPRESKTEGEGGKLRGFSLGMLVAEGW